ncbi:Hsp20/alpha crystallin family protein [Bacillus sp. 3A_MP1]
MEEEQEWIARERFYGPFKREIAIPEEYDLRQIRAKFESGIVTVTVPHRTNEKEKSDDLYQIRFFAG